MPSGVKHLTPSLHVETYAWKHIFLIMYYFRVKPSPGKTLPVFGVPSELHNHQFSPSDKNSSGRFVSDFLSNICQIQKGLYKYSPKEEK